LSSRDRGKRATKGDATMVKARLTAPGIQREERENWLAREKRKERRKEEEEGFRLGDRRPCYLAQDRNHRGRGKEGAILGGQEWGAANISLGS